MSKKSKNHKNINNDNATNIKSNKKKENKNELYEQDINIMLDDEFNSLLNNNIHPKKEILVLSGGASKGVAQLGALHCLKQNNRLNDVSTIAGTSAGASSGM